MKRLIAVIGCVAAPALSACGIGGGSASCDFRQATNSEPRCQERVNTVSAETFKAACEPSGGKGADGVCPREGIVAGCMIGKQGDGSEVIDWFYAPETEESVRTDCDRDSGEFRAKP